VAARVGVPYTQAHRALLNVGLIASDARVQWDREPLLGRVPDAELAAKYNVDRTAVVRARVKRGLPPFTP
jgi:hypothetical protein